MTIRERWRRLASKPGPVAGTAVAVFLTLIWGTTWAAIRISLEGFPPFLGLALRFALGAAILLAIAWMGGVRLGGARHERALWAAQTVCTFGLGFGTLYWAQQWVPSGLTSVLFSTLPLFVLIFGGLFLPEERLGLAGLLGMMAGFAGVTVMFADDLGLGRDRQTVVAALVALLAPVAVALAEVLVKRWGFDVHPLSVTAVPMAAASVLFAGLWMALERGRAVSFEPAPVAALVYLAVFGSAVAFGLFFWLLRHFPVTRLSLMSYGIPVVAVTVGTVLLEEPLTGRIAFGAVLVIVGAALVVKK